MSRFLKKSWGLLLVSLLSILAISPFFTHGFFPMHDDTQVARVYEMGKSLKDGMFPVRWVNDLGFGYGYPIFSFYAPLAYYFGGGLVVLGVDALLATKIMMVVGMLLAAVFMYVFAKSLWGEWAGIVAGVFYEYATYHAVDLYVRGDVAEMWAYAFIPLAFFGIYQIYKLIQENKIAWKGIMVGATGFAGIILSHNLTAMMVTPFLAFFALFLIIFSRNKLASTGLMLLSAIIGVLLSAFYWLPALSEMSYTNVLSQVGGGANFKDHFVCPIQFWYSPWGYGGSVPGCNDGLSFMIGKLHIILSALALISLPFLWKRKEKFWLILFFFFCFIISVFLQTSNSQLIWESLKPMAFLQYPWRFLIFSSFFSSMLAGSIVFIIGQYIPRIPFIILAGILVCITIFLQSKFFVPQKYTSVTSSFYTNDYALIWVASNISDEYMPKNFKKPSNAKEALKILDTSYTTNKTQEKVIKLAANELTAVIPVAYFPTWKAYIDNHLVETRQAQNGISISLNKGTNIVRLVFKNTIVEQIGNMLSITGILMVLIGIIVERKTYAESSK